jgi:hypothetical protein
MRRARFNHPSHGAALSHVVVTMMMIAQKNTRKRRLFRAKEEEMKRRISPKKTQQPSSVARGDARSAVVLVLSIRCINADFALFLHTETS